MKIYHNPRCSKSRQTLALLEDRGIEPEIIEYLKTPPDAVTITGLLGKLGIGAIELIREERPPLQSWASPARRVMTPPSSRPWSHTLSSSSGPSSPRENRPASAAHRETSSISSEKRSPPP